MQAALRLKPEMQNIDQRVIDAQPSMTAAIRLCQQMSGLEDKEIVGRHGIVVTSLFQWKLKWNAD